MLVKDESDRLSLPAFKVLGASWAVQRALAADPAVSHLVAASAGNHGRAVAHVAAARGLRCTVFLPGRAAEARRQAIEHEGAELVVVDGDYETAVLAADQAACRPRTALIADTGTSDSAHAVIDGYATLFDELDTQASFNTLIVPVGVGSLAAAATRYAAPRGITVIATEPATAVCLYASLSSGAPVRVPTPGTTMAGLDCADVSPAAWPSLRFGVRATITVTDRQTASAMADLAAQGLQIGESGAAPLAALRALDREQIALGPTTSVVLLASEGPTAGAHMSDARAP